VRALPGPLGSRGCKQVIDMLGKRRILASNAKCAVQPLVAGIQGPHARKRYAVLRMAGWRRGSYALDSARNSRPRKRTDMEGIEARRLTRRETLKRGAALGGALIWSVPAVQSLTMTAASAQPPSPGTNTGPDISFIALNVICGGNPYFIKWEDDDEEFEDDPGKAPKCEAVFEPTGTKADGDNLGFTTNGPHPASRCVEVIVPPGCAVVASAVKGGQRCCDGETGTGSLVFCPPDCVPPSSKF
jgi:hypothetical protein